MTGSGNETGNVRAFSIAGRLVKRRERLAGMTDDERRWRAQWLKDQELSPEEPRYVPEYYKLTTNIFRRIWRIPGRQFEALLSPFLGKERAYGARLCTGITIYFIAATYCIGYLLKYHSNNFARYRSIEVFTTRPEMYPDEPDYPNFRRKTPQDYYDEGFYSSVLCVDVEPPPPPPPPPASSAPPPSLPPGDFSRYRSIEVYKVRNTQYPDEPGYPYFKKKTPQEFCDDGFYSSPLAK